MNPLELLPVQLRERSISQREIVLPLAQALEAIDHLESQGIQILGWEGWVKDEQGRIGHGNAPQGTMSLQKLSTHVAAQLCRNTIQSDASQWMQDNSNASNSLHFCITVQA
jgi:hypothetical protein